MLIAARAIVGTALVLGACAHDPDATRSPGATPRSTAAVSSPASTGGAPTTTPVQAEPRDLAVVDALVRFARAPSAESAAMVAFAPEVRLGLGDRLLVTRSRAELADPSAWELREGHWRGWVGPFSALRHLAMSTPTIVSVGPHPHCASPPVPAPPELAALRRVSAQPREVETCLRWWTVDVFVTADGRIAGITLDLWEP